MCVTSLVNVTKSTRRGFHILRADKLEEFVLGTGHMLRTDMEVYLFGLGRLYWQKAEGRSHCHIAVLCMCFL